MTKRIFALLAVLSICLVLFGCGDKTDGTDKQNSAETTTAPQKTEEDLLPQDGYYILKDYEAEINCYLHLQNMEGTIYMFNLPIDFSLEDDGIHIDGQEPQEYTYKNEKLTFTMNETKLSLQYIGEELPEKYMPIVPPAGTYQVSSIGVDGDMVIYGAETEEILELSEDGTGTFYFAAKAHQIVVQDGQFTVDGEPIGFSYYPEGGDEPILMLLWMTEDASSIALRPVTES